VTCNKVDVNKGGILNTSKVIGYPLQIAELQAISGVSKPGELSPRFVLTSSGHRIEVWSSIITQEDTVFWPIIKHRQNKKWRFLS